MRLLDYFVTIYCKNNKNNIYKSYINQLKKYKKNNFDVFCRKERICFYYEDDKYIITSIGQLNYFKWIIENDIINSLNINLNNLNINLNKKNRKCKKR